MNLHKMIEICLKDDNMHGFVMINALICINNYVITCINSMLSRRLRGVIYLYNLYSIISSAFRHTEGNINPLNRRVL